MNSNLMLENNTYQKELLLIIKSSSVKKNFFYQVIDSGIKRKKEIRKLKQNKVKITPLDVY